MTEFVVAIDGQAGSGKSTTAKAVAQRLGFLYLDTGAMYRALTLKYFRAGGRAPLDRGLIQTLLRDTAIDLVAEASGLRVLLDGEDVSRAIRAPAVNELVSPVAAVKEVRDWMVERQRAIARGKRIVCEGRDMTTVVFPEAQVKVFMDADAPTRARRRLQELQEQGIQARYEEVLANLEYRDRYDSSRTHSPLKRAPDAHLVDTTDLTIEEEIALVERFVRDELGKRGDG